MQAPQDSLELRNLELQLLPDVGVEIVGVELVAILHAVAESRIDQFNAELFHQQDDVVINRRDTAGNRYVAAFSLSRRLLWPAVRRPSLLPANQRHFRTGCGNRLVGIELGAVGSVGHDLAVGTAQARVIMTGTVHRPMELAVPKMGKVGGLLTLQRSIKTRY